MEKIYIVQVNPFNPGGDWYVISPNSFNTLSDNPSNENDWQSQLSNMVSM